VKTLLPLTLLGLSSFATAANEHAAAEATAADHGKGALEATAAAITEADLRRYVTRLASAEYEGRGTGDRGERMATAYLATFFEGLGLQARGDDGSYYQVFDFRAGMELSGANSLSLNLDEPVGLVRRFTPGEHYQPLSVSASGRVDTGVVFAGFGIAHGDYNSFEGLEVKGKWLMVFRGNPKERKELVRFGPLVAKANLAKEKGAAGIIYVKGTNPAISAELMPPGTSVGGSKPILPALTITDRLAASLLTGQGDVAELKALFESYNEDKRAAGFPLPYRIAAEIGIAARKDYGRNVVACLVSGEAPSKEAIVIGAHIDHLGHGNRGGTRAKGEEAGGIHFGADDNASGVAVVMELAQFFADRKKAGKLALKRDLIFAGWSGEELGLHGSRHFVAEAKRKFGAELYPGIAAYLNLDMVGKLRDKNLIIHGTGSSKAWPEILDGVADRAEFQIERSPSPHIPTDTTPFYEAGVPVLAPFTGLHDDYHTPRDTVDKIDFPGLGKVSLYLHALTVALADRPEAPGYVKFDRTQGAAPKVRIGMRPENNEGGGVRAAQVMPDSPAERAGLREGDVLQKLDGAEVKDVEGLLAALRKLEAGHEYEVVARRGAEEVTVKIVPEAR